MSNLSFVDDNKYSVNNNRIPSTCISLQFIAMKICSLYEILGSQVIDYEYIDMTPCSLVVPYEVLESHDGDRDNRLLGNIGSDPPEYTVSHLLKK